MGLAVAALHAERVLQGHLIGLEAAEALPVDVGRRAAVKFMHSVRAGARDEHRVADRTPAVADADADRRVGADRDADHRVGQDRAAVEQRRDAAPVGAATDATDERDARAGDRVRAPDQLGLALGRSVGQQHQDLVLAVGDVADAGRGARARVARVVGGADGGHRERQPLAAERDHDDRVARRAVERDLARRRAADDRQPGRDLGDLAGQGARVVGPGGEDQQQLRRSVVGARAQRGERGLPAGRHRIRMG